MEKLMEFDINKKPFSTEFISGELLSLAADRSVFQRHLSMVNKFLCLINPVFFIIFITLLTEASVLVIKYVDSTLALDSSSKECLNFIPGFFNISFCYDFWNYGYVLTGLFVVIIIFNHKKYALNFDLLRIEVKKNLLMPLTEEGNLESYLYLKDVADKYPQVKNYLKALDRKPIMEEFEGIKIWENEEKERLEILRQEGLEKEKAGKESLKNKPVKKDETTLAKGILIELTSLKET